MSQTDDETLDGISPTEFWLTEPRFSDEGTLVATMKEEIGKLPSFKEMSPRFLTRVVYTFGLCQRNHYKRNPATPLHGLWKGLEKEWSAAAVEKLPRFSSKYLTNAFVSFPYLEAAPPEEFSGAFFALVTDKLDDFNSRDTATLFYALSSLKRVGATFDLSPEFKNSLMKTLTRKIPEFDLRETANILYQMVDLGIAPDASFWKAYFPAARDKIQNYRMKDLANNVRALNKLDIPLNDVVARRFMFHYVSVLERNLPDFNSRDIATIMGAFSRMGVAPTEAFWNIYFPTVSRRLKTFEPRELSTTLHSLGRLGIAPTNEFFESFTFAASKQMDGFTSQAVANMLFALAFISTTKPLPGEVRAFAGKLVDKAKTMDLLNAEERQCFLACLRLFPGQEKSFSPRATQRTSSPGEAAFLDLLIAADLHPDEKNAFIPELITNTDYGFCIGNRRVFVELDGPHHFVVDFQKNTVRYNGATRFMTELISDFRPDAVLVRVALQDFETLSPSGKTAIILEIKAQTGKLDPGAHRLVSCNGKIGFVPLVFAQSNRPSGPKGFNPNAPELS